MTAEAPGQVQLFELIFTMSWEDPEIDRRALAIRPGEEVVAVTSGGCNIFSFLLDDPSAVYALDINPTQSHLLELKMAALRHLDHAALLEFLGVRPSDHRLQTLTGLLPGMSAEAGRFWQERPEIIGSGVLGAGRYEQFIRLFRRFLNVVQGRRRIERLFEADTLSRQRDYYDVSWNTARWRAIFPLFFNKRMLARRGLAADYFQFDDGSVSFADSFFRRAEHAMTALPVRENYFLSQYLLGKYLSEEALPPYLQARHLDTLRRRLDRIHVVTADLKHWLAARPPRSIDAYALSNICELMDAGDTEATFAQVERTAREGGRMVFRNLMISRTVPESLAVRLVRDEALSRTLRENDRSFVYSRLDALRLADSPAGGKEAQQ